jgi:alkaline phosphatase
VIVILILMLGCIHVGLFGLTRIAVAQEDFLRAAQLKAIEEKKAEWGHWGSQPTNYSQWRNHSNRLIPVYTFGIDLQKVKGANSLYRDEQALIKLYGKLPDETLNPDAEYFDQTDIYRLQKDAISAGKKYIFLVIFDGMDWQSSRDAAIYRTQNISFESGRGTGLHFMDYRGAKTDFGWMVTSAHSNGSKDDVDAQIVTTPVASARGGYSARMGGNAPWDAPLSDDYLLGKDRKLPHLVTDSASSATSMTAGIKTFNAAINVDPEGKQVEPIARWLQREHKFSIGVVTSVPISHATPAAAYANNVSRDDYQDLSRDLVGLPSIAHREVALPGVDVLIGGGWGIDKETDGGQGKNFVPGNRYLPQEEIAEIDVEHGGKYVIAQRTKGRPGNKVLGEAAELAAKQKHRLFGFFGVEGGHLPFQTADGGYNPTRGASAVEVYKPEDISENPTLAEMTSAALVVLEQNPQGFWMMVEAGDVDWANHNDNIDDSIGAVFSGDAAVKAITDWVEAHDAWDDAAVIVTADHGHYFVLDDPKILLAPQPENSR